MISIDTAETDEFINITSAVPCDFSDEFSEFSQTPMIENNIGNAHDASRSAVDLQLYLLSKIEEYSYST